MRKCTNACGNYAQLGSTPPHLLYFQVSIYGGTFTILHSALRHSSSGMQKGHTRQSSTLDIIAPMSHSAHHRALFSFFLLASNVLSARSFDCRSSALQLSIGYYLQPKILCEISSAKQNIMADMDSTTVIATASALCAVLLGGVLVYANHAGHQTVLESAKQDVEDRLSKVADLEKEVKKQEVKLEEESRLLEAQRLSLKTLESNLKNQKDELEKREAAVAEAEAVIQTKEQDLQQRREELEKEAAERDDEKTADTELSLDEEDQHEVEDEPPVQAEAVSASSSEAEKRRKMIDEELANLVKEANENELEEPFDEESIEALRKAAHKICYLKKYYDVMKDSVIYFPSVTKTVVDYTLIEEAEKYYYEEEDEYPQDLSIGLRSVATMAVAEDDDDVDEDYMLALSQDVEL
jgi:hypothetical protein